MSPLAIRIAIAELLPRYQVGNAESGSAIIDRGKPGSLFKGPLEPLWPRANKWPVTCPDYTKSLDALQEVETAILENERYSVRFSSNPHDHVSARYIAALAKACGIQTREELIISVSNEDKSKLNFRPGPYPTPIELPPSAIVLGHSIPAYGYELSMIRATALQRCEALLRAVGKWEDAS